MQEPLHGCIMVRVFKEHFNTLVSRAPWVGGTMSVNIEHKLYKFIHVSVLETCSQSVGIFKDWNHWFLPPKLYTFMFGLQPSVEANARPRTVCCGMSWWPKAHIATSWIGITPGIFVACHLSPVSPTLLHCLIK